MLSSFCSLLSSKIPGSWRTVKWDIGHARTSCKMYWLAQKNQGWKWYIESIMHLAEQKLKLSLFRECKYIFTCYSPVFMSLEKKKLWPLMYRRWKVKKAQTTFLWISNFHTNLWYVLNSVKDSCLSPFLERNARKFMLQA